MSKVITINLNGVAYQVEESGYDALQDYLENAARRLEGNPDKVEIIADIEQAIGEKFRALLGPYKTVVTTGEVERVIVEMGPVQDPSAPTEEAAGAAATGFPSTAEEFVRRAKAGYYEGMKSFHDKRAHRAWKRKFKQELRGWKRAFRQHVRAQAHEWRRNWQSDWTPRPQPSAGGLIALPLLWTLSWLLGILVLFAALSLLFTGGVFGLMLPLDTPLWVGFLFLFVIYQVVASPVKAMRQACWDHGYGYRQAASPFSHFWESLARVGLLALLVWLANRYIPAAHAALEAVPPVAHHFVEHARAWWARR
jgi:hypothetical protein